MLLTPNGEPARDMERVMLLATWARHLAHEQKQGINLDIPPIIIAGMGKPTFPINHAVAKTAATYWDRLLKTSEKARQLLPKFKTSTPEEQKNLRDAIAKIAAAVDYGEPQGDYAARALAANALTEWYGNKITIQPDHILFTVGGVSALHNIFTVINRRIPNGIIVTPFPYYPAYAGPHNCNNLFPINLIDKPGYRLTAEILNESLISAYKKAECEKTCVSTFILCDPNNPLGTVLIKNELKKMVSLLAQHPDILIVLDEAYAEMRFNDDHDSLFSQAAEYADPTVINRIILMRSGTKALSTAGERMALAVTLNESIMNELLLENISLCGHAPYSSQIAFAEGLAQLDKAELINLREYYQPQVNYVVKRLTAMGAAMPDKDYRVEGTFYVLANLSELFGEELPTSSQRALNKTGKITTDEDIAYSLLFENGLMVAPLSYFGLSPQQGYIRITCSGGDSELEDMMSRIEMRLIQAR